MRKRNLVLVNPLRGHARTQAHLEMIAKAVDRLDAAIRCVVVPHKRLPQFKLLPMWRQPTLSVSFHTLRKRKYLPGRLLSGVMIDKVAEFKRLEAAGAPVPKWVTVTPDLQLDPAEWGPYVVEKPVAGRRGAFVRARRTTRVRYQAPETLPEDHLGRKAPMLVQRFVYTGEWPTSYRVYSLFGEPLVSWRQTARNHGFPLRERWGFSSGGGASIVANTKDTTVELVEDEEVIALAKRVHRVAFPEVPALGFDIVRDIETEELFVLECHPHGNWIFSRKLAHDIETHNGIDLLSQCDPINTAARILAQETRRLAEVRLPTPWPARHG